MEKIAVGISSVKVVPVLLVISLPKEQAGLVQLLLLSKSPNFIFGCSNLLSEQSESSFTSPQLFFSSNRETEYLLFRLVIA
ncbi:hypothetical protein [Clostridium chromiireducens]|uniref:hypothetical protein n=1 Tax=Clostridium chromiireducens TaxID=225345 RepID=UPI0013651E87|nr:hypothetical protein [Clostridium chromiireducens]